MDLNPCTDKALTGYIVLALTDKVVESSINISVVSLKFMSLC